MNEFIVVNRDLLFTQNDNLYAAWPFLATAKITIPAIFLNIEIILKLIRKCLIAKPKFQDYRLLRLKSDQYPHFIMESVENYWVPTLFNISLFFLCVMNLPLQCFKLSIRCNRMKLLCNSFCSLSKRHCSSNSESSQDAVAIFTDYLLYRRLENSLDVKGSDSPLSGKILQNLKLTKLS